MLIDKLKFDLRIYVLVTNFIELTAYIYKEGLARFATVDYETPNKNNIDDKMQHLTNYFINKKNPKFIFNNSETNDSKGHKRSLTSIYKYLHD